MRSGLAVTDFRPSLQQARSQFGDRKPRPAGMDHVVAVRTQQSEVGQTGRHPIAEGFDGPYMVTLDESPATLAISLQITEIAHLTSQVTRSLQTADFSFRRSVSTARVGGEGPSRAGPLEPLPRPDRLYSNRASPKASAERS